MATLRQQVLASLCHMLCLFDGDAARGMVASSASSSSSSVSSSSSDLLSLYISSSSLLARLILGERLRWEKELKQLERAERLAGSGGKSGIHASAAALSPKQKPTPAALSQQSGFSKSAVTAAQQLVERAATAVESVLRELESRPVGDQLAATQGAAAKFAAEANGITEAEFSHGASLQTKR